jgi:hypothetical protein
MHTLNLTASSFHSTKRANYLSPVFVRNSLSVGTTSFKLVEQRHGCRSALLTDLMRVAIRESLPPPTPSIPPDALQYN